MNLGYFYKNFLFIALPFTLLSGAFLADLSITIISLIFIKSYLLNKDYEFFNNKIFNYFLFVYFILILSVFFISPAPLIKQGTSIFFFRFFFFMFALHFFLMEKKNYHQFSKLFFIIFCLLFFDSIIQFFNGKNILGFERLAPHRISSFFGDELIMGGFIVKIFPIILIFLSSLIITEKKRSNFFLLLIISSLILIILSGERTSLGMFLLQIVFIILFSKNFLIKKVIFYAFLFIIFLFSTLNFIHSSDLNKIKTIKAISDTKNIFTRFEHGFKNYLSIENKNLTIIKSHSGHYKTAFKIFNDNKLFGGGIKSFRYLCSSEKYSVSSSFRTEGAPAEYNYVKSTNSCANHPHNTLLLFMSDLGVPGLVIYLTFMLFIIINFLQVLFSNSIKKVSNNNYENYVYITGGLLSITAPILPNGNFFNNYMLIIFFILLSYYITSHKKLLEND